MAGGFAACCEYVSANSDSIPSNPPTKTQPEMDEVAGIDNAVAIVIEGGVELRRAG